MKLAQLELEFGKALNRYSRLLAANAGARVLTKAYLDKEKVAKRYYTELRKS